MDLKNYLLTLDKPKLDQLAADCGCSVGHLRNCAYGSRTPTAAMAVAIEKFSNRSVRRQDLFPENFRRIWPELKAA